MFISRHFPSRRFAFFSGMGMGVGGLGLLFTGTPLAWLVQHWGWRTGFGLLAVLSLLSWLLISWRVHEPEPPTDAAAQSWGHAFRRMGAAVLLPHTWAL
jgi:MFS family permease